jgi:hypothetical protein
MIKFKATITIEGIQSHKDDEESINNAIKEAMINAIEGDDDGDTALDYVIEEEEESDF